MAEVRTMEIPEISFETKTPPKPEVKSPTEPTVKNELIVVSSPEKQSDPDFYCPGNLIILSSSKDSKGKDLIERVNTFFVSPPPGEPEFDPKKLNAFMRHLNLSQVVPGFDPNTKPEYIDSYISDPYPHHFELGRIEFNIDQPGIKKPIIDIGEKPAEPEKQIIIVYPYDRIATLVYEYQAGIISPDRAKKDNPEYQTGAIPTNRVSHDNPNFDYALHRITEDQLKIFKEQASKE